MDDSRLARVTGSLAVPAGACWTAASLTHASQPTGCVGEGCALTTMRESAPLTVLLLVVAGGLLVASGAGVLVLLHRHGRLARSGRVGAAAVAVGLAVLAVAALVNEVFYDGDFPLMPAFVLPGAVLVAAGLGAVGWTLLRSRLLPRWVSALLVVGALLLPVANEQTSAVLLAVPFGVAWAVAGVVLAVTHGRSAVSGPVTSSAEGAG